MSARDIDIGGDPTVFTFRADGVAVMQIIPPTATASLPAAPPEGSFGYDTTLGKLVVWTGAAYEAVTSV